ncbi:glycine--tRNA ligase subunit beta [Neptunicella sp. SCSIO 80796]|uniref:glycine--tRNA ligase subunit beta n=1 Tax=Neptunicella plasticusilytica TaxID=3117012 RepID=UPI003A4D3FBC
MQPQNLLIEIGTEELPPKSLTELAGAFADHIQAGLEAAELSFTGLKWYATPRRLAVSVNQLDFQQADKVVEKRGPAVSAAFDPEGNPTKAAMGWAKGNGIDVSQADRLTTDKGEWLVYQATVIGQSLTELIEDLVTTALAKLPVPKPMRWGSGKSQFIRPVHSVTLLYGDRLLDANILGIDSSRVIYGHRFHGAKTFELTHADNYLEALQQHYVVADFKQRKKLIEQDILDAAAKENGVADIDSDLLNEVTALVEWPVVLVASFEDKFLDVPKEALIYTMKGDQKYFPVLDNNGQLRSRFIFVTNIESKDPRQIIQGNEKVIRPRLADAEFFFQTDKKQTLESRMESLSTVLFQKQLGTLKEKSERIAKLAKAIALQINADGELAYRAGLLCKTDLMTDMVMEFPDVQGVMGMYYANHDGEDSQVANALNEQYKPRFAGDTLPQSPISCAVALADKLDTLVGIFGIGMLPKGDKDPFALRRAAIGVLRIIADNNLSLDLVDLIELAKNLLLDKLSNDQVDKDVLEFILARFRAIYQEQNISVDVIQAVLARKPTRPADFAARIKGVAHFSSLDGAQSLAAANKRVGNILNKNEEAVPEACNPSLLQEPAEVQLNSELSRIKEITSSSLASGDYQAVLSELAKLKDSIDAFFDSVMVMTDDQTLRLNRLALLQDLHQQFLHVADISLLNQ